MPPRSWKRTFALTLPHPTVETPDAQYGRFLATVLRCDQHHHTPGVFPGPSENLLPKLRGWFPDSLIMMFTDPNCF